MLPGEAQPGSSSVASPTNNLNCPNPAQLHAGGYFSCVVSTLGALRCWGDNMRGQLGIGSTTTIGDGPGEMPPAQTDVAGPVSQLALGWAHGCALLVSGEVRCWGFNGFGQLGQGNLADLGDGPGEMPPPVVDVGAGTVVQLVAGGHHNCVLLDNNKVRCWGFNSHGQLGEGNADDRGDGPGEMPPPDIDLGVGTIIKIGAAAYGNCALFDNGDLRCWGYNFAGALGIGNNNKIGDAPGEMPPANTNYGAGTIVDMTGGPAFYSVLLADGSVRNWGNGSVLGYNSADNIGDEPGEMPPPNVSFGGTAIAISRGASGGSHTCVMLQDMTVRCWGENQWGQLGIGHTNTVGDAPGEMPPAVTMAY